MFTWTLIKLDSVEFKCVRLAHNNYIMSCFHKCSSSQIQLNLNLYGRHHYENTPFKKYWEFYHQKNENFQMKNSGSFHVSAPNIDCWHLLEPPRRGGSTEYPQSIFWSRNKKTKVHPCKPQFYCIKVGLKGIKTIYACFRDDSNNIIPRFHERSSIRIHILFPLNFFVNSDSTDLQLQRPLHSNNIMSCSHGSCSI